MTSFQKQYRTMSGQNGQRVRYLCPDAWNKYGKGFRNVPNRFTSLSLVPKDPGVGVREYKEKYKYKNTNERFHFFLIFVCLHSFLSSFVYFCILRTGIIHESIFFFLLNLLCFFINFLFSLPSVRISRWIFVFDTFYNLYL